MAIYPCVKHNYWPGYLCAKCNGDEPEKRGEEMQRYSEAAGTEGSVIEATNGEYVLYAEHCEAMKRIAGDSAQQAEPEYRIEERPNSVIIWHGERLFAQLSKGGSNEFKAARANAEKIVVALNGAAPAGASPAALKVPEGYRLVRAELRDEMIRMAEGMQRQGLDFTPDAQHTVADMANVGYSLMQAIKAYRPGYAWNDTPAEIVGDLANEIAESASPAALTAKQRYDECMREGEEPSAVERLRFFCSLAMDGQDWLDVEPFFDALAASPADQAPIAGYLITEDGQFVEFLVPDDVEALAAYRNADVTITEVVARKTHE